MSCFWGLLRCGGKGGIKHEVSELSTGPRNPKPLTLTGVSRVGSQREWAPCYESNFLSGDHKHIWEKRVSSTECYEGDRHNYCAYWLVNDKSKERYYCNFHQTINSFKQRGWVLLITLFLAPNIGQCKAGHLDNSWISVCGIKEPFLFSTVNSQEC